MTNGDVTNLSFILTSLTNLLNKERSAYLWSRRIEITINN